MTDRIHPALTGTPVLGTARLTLRAPRPSDWPHFRDFIATDHARFVGGPVDTAKAWRSFGHVIGMWVLRGYGSFVFCTTGSQVPLGMTGPWHPIDWPEPEIGWALWDTASQGRGLAFEAAAAARDFAFHSLGWATAVSYIHPDNRRSIALAHRLGAVHDTKAAHPGNEPCLVFRHAKAPGQP